MCEVIDIHSLNEAELQALENYWRCGQLQSRSDAIVNFVECHRDEILELAGENRDSAALIAATQRLICAYRSLDLPAELQDQIHEINNEIWYRGQKGDYDRARIQREWAEQHAPNWRRWRIIEYLYVTYHLADVVVARICQPDPLNHENCIPL
jgi:hypothetical protein